MAVLLRADGPWGQAPRNRKLRPWETPKWEMIEPKDRVFERLDRHEEELCEVRQAIELARDLPMGWRDSGTDEFHRVDPRDQTMTFRPFL